MKGFIQMKKLSILFTLLFSFSTFFSLVAANKVPGKISFETKSNPGEPPISNVHLDVN